MTMGFELKEIEYHSGKAYEVWRDGKRLGVVRHCFPTFERGPKQRMWVTRRWTAKKPYWEYLEGDSYWAPRGIFCETRKNAIERLIWAVDRA